jgi:uncharacterized YigZ family protein
VKQEEGYHTLAGASEAIHRVLASKHIGYAWHVREESSVNSLLHEIRKNHHQAAHVCYAWRLGWDKSIHRFSDDGEPSGTAGKPIFGQILSFDLTNVLIAVVRYFGGTKLGTGGLIDAYRTAARMAIDANRIILMPVRDRFVVRFPYNALPAVMKTFKEAEYERIRSEWDEICEAEILVPAYHSGRIIGLKENIEACSVELLERC